MMKGHPDDLRAVAERCKAGLNALLLQAMMIPEEHRMSLTKSLLGVVESLRELGVDIDPATLALATAGSLGFGLRK
jgi:hypothetical protein